MVTSRWLHIALLAFLPIFLWGQDDFISLEIKSKTVEVGQEIVITIKTNIEGKIKIELPDSFTRSGGKQSGMTSSGNFVNGQKSMSRTIFFQSFSGYFKEKGNYDIGPAKVFYGDKKLQSDSYTVQVTERQNMISQNPEANSNQPIFGIIEQSKKEIYEGEPIVLEGKIYSQVNLLRIEDYSPFTFNGPCVTHSLDKTNQITINYEKVSGRTLQTFKVGKQIIFPEKIGEYQIKPFQTTILYDNMRRIFPESMKIVSNEATVKVKPLPGNTPKEFIDAVGKFSVTTGISRGNLSQGEVVELKITVKGKGNLQNIRQPIFTLPKGISLYGNPEISDDFSYCTSGASGEKSFVYFLQMNNPGVVQLAPIKIAYFNPIAEKYEFSESPIQEITVEKSDKKIPMNLSETVNQASPNDIQPYITENSQHQRSRFTDFFGEFEGTFILFSPIFAGAFLGLFLRAKKRNEEKSDTNNNLTTFKNEILQRLEILENDENNSTKYEEVSSLFTQFLARYFAVNNSEITRTFLLSKVPEKLTSEQYDKMIEVFNGLDAVKFGQSIDIAKENDWINKVKNIISTIDL